MFPIAIEFNIRQSSRQTSQWHWLIYYIICVHTGTPGVGKSRLCAELANKLDYKWQDVSTIAKENGFVDGYDETLECPELDEDKVMFADDN